MGSHFHDWIDYKGVAFSVELLEWSHIFEILEVGKSWQVGIWGIKKIGRFLVKKKLLYLVLLFIVMKSKVFYIILGWPG